MERTDSMTAAGGLRRICSQFSCVHTRGTGQPTRFCTRTENDKAGAYQHEVAMRQEQARLHRLGNLPGHMQSSSNSGRKTHGR